MTPASPTGAGGPAGAAARSPHLSARCCNCGAASLQRRSPTPPSAAQTMLVLMKPSDKLAITDFCHCHRGRRRRTRRRTGGAEDGSPRRAPPSPPPHARWQEAKLLSKLTPASWISGAAIVSDRVTRLSSRRRLKPGSDDLKRPQVPAWRTRVLPKSVELLPQEEPQRDAGTAPAGNV